MINLSIIITAIIGYLAVIFKEIPMQLLNMLLNKTTNSFTVLSKNKIIYEITNRWIFELNKSQLSNHINGNQIKDDSYDNCIKYSIDYGNYLIRLKHLNFIYVEKKLIENSYDTYDKISIKFIGINKDFYKNNLLKKIQNEHESSNKIRVYPCNNLWDNYLTDKKDFNNIICSQKDKIIKFLDK